MDKSLPPASPNVAPVYFSLPPPLPLPTLLLLRVEKEMEKKGRGRLLGMTLGELEQVARRAGLPAYAGAQMADWVYKKRVQSIGQMTNLPAARRAWLEERFEVGIAPPVRSVASADGTMKYLFPAAGGFVESVYIPSGGRATLCVSSQVGCKRGCLFCRTSRQGFSGDLTAGEMLNQLHALPQPVAPTNLVFMGMGEPLDNVGETLKALDLLTAQYAYGWSPRRITVSTVGAGGLKRFLAESACHLAFSLHAPTSAERLSIMPSEKAFPMRNALALIKQHDFSGQRRVSFEYIVFKGFNDSGRHAVALAGLLRGIRCRINLLRYHALPDAPLESADVATMERFRDALIRQGLRCTIRASRGEDIHAACGMLATAGQ